MSIELFSTCPPSSSMANGQAYQQRVADVARWSEKYGCKGILVYTDNSLIDPWLVAHTIIQHTQALCPLVAVQPIYMHPYTVAKMVTTFGHLYGRHVYLNMVAGGFKNDLGVLHDATPHDKRYDRLREYTLIIQKLLAGTATVSYKGEFYHVERLKLTPPLPPDLFPGIFVSGSSEAGLATAHAIGATAIQYPQPASTFDAVPADSVIASGIRIGIIAREDEDAAWAVALKRFPPDRKGQLTQQVAMKVSDSVWHKQLSQMGEETENSPYWLVPFQNYKTFCPYLVGSYERVAEDLSRYITAGYKTIILDVPPDEEDLHYTKLAFEHAEKAVGQ